MWDIDVYLCILLAWVFLRMLLSSEILVVLSYCFGSANSRLGASNLKNEYKEKKHKKHKKHKHKDRSRKQDPSICIDKDRMSSRDNNKEKNGSKAQNYGPDLFMRQQVKAFRQS
ncbi:uncharacterized protein LOC132611456 [Lycium barbarum]|uniref:uncharacterized protein LOC132611456 n=1 Tax=Lycium barbarum TaxID=112863 RepID=UPI00293F1B2A|nr:uncharacterized protein LOC132611456 [Lycium barbarum]